MNWRLPNKEENNKFLKETCADYSQESQNQSVLSCLGVPKPFTGPFHSCGGFKWSSCKAVDRPELQDWEEIWNMWMFYSHIQNCLLEGFGFSRGWVRRGILAKSPFFFNLSNLNHWGTGHKLEYLIESAAMCYWNKENTQQCSGSFFGLCRLHSEAVQTSVARATIQTVLLHGLPIIQLWWEEKVSRPF